MDFSDALRAMRGGARLTRERWENPETYVVARHGYPDGIPVNEDTARAVGMEPGTVCRFLPYLMVRVADGSFGPWAPTQLDLFAEDWGRV